MSKLWDFVKTDPEISYNEENKAEYKKLGQSFLKSVLVAIPSHRIAEKRIGYNAGGIAVSGDHSLYVMFENGQGACVFFDADFGEYVTFRTISHIKDFSGGPNKSKSRGILENSIYVAAELMKLGGYGGEEVIDAT